MTSLVKPIYDVNGVDVVALGELEPGETAVLPGALEFPDGSQQTSAALPPKVTDIPPADPIDGQTWFETDTGKMYIYYVNPMTQLGSWVSVSSQAGNGAISIGSEPPANPTVGQTWFESDTGGTYFWYLNPTSQEGSWVAASNLTGGAGAGIGIWSAEDRPVNPTPGTLGFNTSIDRYEGFGNSFWQILMYERYALAPTGVTARLTGVTSAEVDYAPSGNEVADNVVAYEAVSTPDGIIGRLDTQGGGTIPMVGLASNKDYTFTVYAINNVGRGEPSAPSNSIHTPDFPSAPVITNGRATDYTAISVDYTPSPNAGAELVIAHEIVVQPGDITRRIDSADAGTFVVDGLADNADYTATVYAVSDLGRGAPSNVFGPIHTPRIPVTNEWPVNGSYQFTVPDLTTGTISVRVVAGGGGAGGFHGGGDYLQGGSGGSGGYIDQDITVTAGQVIDIVVGIGGRGGAYYNMSAGSWSCPGTDNAYNEYGGDGTGSSVSSNGSLIIETFPGGGGQPHGNAGYDYMNGAGGAAGTPNGAPGVYGSGYNDFGPLPGGANGTGYGSGGASNGGNPSFSCSQAGQDGYVRIIW